MFDRILVGYLDSEQGRDALELGGMLARATGAELLVGTAPSEGGEDLTRMALARAADLVVLGSTHRGPLGRVVPGATVARLLGEAPCAVAVAPPGFAAPAASGVDWRPLAGEDGDAGLRVVGVGYDGSSAARAALETATELALRNGAALRVFTVAPRYPRVPGAEGGAPAPDVPSEAEALQQLLHDAVAELPAEARALPVFLRGLAATELVRAGEGGIDLIVLGSRPGGPLRRALHGSVSAGVLVGARCPVLISPAGVRAPAELSR